MSKVPVIRDDEYQDALDNDGGWCTNCKDFTHDGCEPDAEEYRCPECENDTVYGVENALLMGLFEISDPDYGDGHDFENLDSD